MVETNSGGAQESRPDLTLDLLAPFVDSTASSTGSGQRWSAAQAREVREKLEKAVKANKTKTHSLLVDNFSTISTHIQLASSLQDQHSRISTRLSSLEGEIDPSNSSTSFLPPVISSLDKHFTASNRHTRASAHVKALKALQVQAEYVGRLEEAIWGGRGGEEWVVKALGPTSSGSGTAGEPGQTGEGGGGAEGIEGTKIASAINTRVQLYRSMLLEQLSEAFGQAVSLTTAKGGKETILRVQGEMKLQQPRIPRPENRSSPSGPAPAFTLPHLLSTLSSLSTLPPLLSALSSRLMRDIVRPLLAPESTFRLVQSTDAGSKSLRLTAGGGITGAREKIEDVRVFLSFLSSSVFPPPSTSSPSSAADTGADSGSGNLANLSSTRDSFLSEVSTSTLSLLLDLVLIPSMPASLSAIPAWLDLLSSAAELESFTTTSPTDSSFITSSADYTSSTTAHSASPPTPSNPPPGSQSGIIKRFLEEKAGEEWVKSRSCAAMEEVKALVVRGWGGWDGMEVRQMREVVVLVEEEIEDETPANGDADGRGGVRAGVEGSGSGAKGVGGRRGADGVEIAKEGGMDVDPEEGEGEEDGWGLDSPITATRPDSPSGTADSRSVDAEGAVGLGGVGEDDAWGFDDDNSNAANPPPTSSATTAQPSQADQADDGWDFDLTSSSSGPSTSTSGSATTTAAKAPAKPVREAKKLGKRVAKAKAAVQAEDDSEDYTMASSTAGDVAGNHGGLGGVGDGAGEETGGWGWDDPEPPQPTLHSASSHTSSHSTAPLSAAPTSTLAASARPTTPVPASKKRVVTRQERRKVEETYLVSKACDRLLGLVERCLAEAREMEISSLPASFTGPHPHLRHTALSLLDTFRALLPLILNQIRDVPTLSMQLSNDLSYIASRLSPSSPLNPSDSSTTFPTDIPPISSSQAGAEPTLSERYALDAGDASRRLLAASSHIYESTLSAQLSGLMSLIDEAQGWEGVGLVQGGKRCEGVMRDLGERLGGLGRVWKVVLPPSSFYPTLGYLIDQTVSRITSEILSLVDITEVESEKLEELLRMLSPLEAIFEGAEPPTSIIAHTPHWLKHLYLAELLRANLVDITYLHQSGALVDFTTEELVGVVKALFADSEKRDRAIEGIERGRE